MDENEQDASTVVSMTPRRRKSAPRKAAPRKAATARKSGKPPVRRKAAARRKTAGGPSFEAVIRSITGGVTVARAAIAEASGQGVAVMRRAAGGASKTSRKTVKRLAAEWEAMDPKKKAGVLAALLGAAAAASVPLVRRTFKK